VQPSVPRVVMVARGRSPLPSPAPPTRSTLGWLTPAILRFLSPPQFLIDKHFEPVAVRLQSTVSAYSIFG
jgi:hypothetical protein